MLMIIFDKFVDISCLCAVENIRDFFDKLMLTQKEAIEAGEEEANTLTDTHLVQTVFDLFGGKY